MSLCIGKLEQVKELGGGMVQARCPACAEAGHDRAGKHLRIYPDGRFGCCVYPKDREHRKRIFALTGDRTPRRFTVRLVSPSVGRSPERSVAAALTDFARTLRTAVSESDSDPANFPTSARTLRTPVLESESTAAEIQEEFRTLRTPFSNPRAYSGKKENIRCDNSCICKDWERSVLSVLEQERGGQTPETPENGGERLPYLTPKGTLVIPFDSPERYHWWKPDGKRLTVQETLAEVRGRLAATERKEDHGTGI